MHLLFCPDVHSCNAIWYFQTLKTDAILILTPHCTSISFEFEGLLRDQKPDYKSEKSQDRTEDFNNQHLHKSIKTISISFRNLKPGNYLQARISSIGQCRATTVDPNRDATYQITHPNGQARPEQRVAGILIATWVDITRVIDKIELWWEDDGHDDSIDGHDFTKDDWDQILRSYSGCLNASSNDRWAGDEDTPVASVSASIYRTASISWLIPRCAHYR